MDNDLLVLIEFFWDYGCFHTSFSKIRTQCSLVSIRIFMKLKLGSINTNAIHCAIRPIGSLNQEIALKVNNSANNCLLCNVTLKPKMYKQLKMGIEEYREKYLLTFKQYHDKYDYRVSRFLSNNYDDKMFMLKNGYEGYVDVAYSLYEKTFEFQLNSFML